MKCTQCSAENREGRRFCAECGSPLTLVCPSCDFLNEPGEKFCGGCGDDLSVAATPSDPKPTAPDPQTPSPPAESATSGERRQATIVFSDLAGYTAMNERLDPEEVEGVMRRVKEEAVRVVEAHGGIVNQFVGDEVLALFGIPVAHGDDPDRAARSALELHDLARRLSPEVEDKIGQPLRMHTGIHSGLIVTNLRDNRDGRYGITGDTVNTGARLKAEAEADQILVSQSTQKAIALLFETERLESVDLKGKAGATAVFRLIREREAPERARLSFVGRPTELRQFTSILETCRESACGQAICVRGEAGIGKSALVEEFRALAEREGFACHAGLVLDFGVGKGRDAIRSLMRSLLGLGSGSGGELRAAAASRALADGLVDAEREAFLNDLLDLPQPPALRAIYDAMDNQVRNNGKRDAVADLVRRVSEKQALMLIIEDLHWADPPTMAHLAKLTALVSEVPALLIMTSRLEGDPLDQVWRSASGGSPLTTFDLGPLRTEEAFELAGAFIDISSRIAKNCVERAEGNPLFLEQLLRSAEETAEDSVPGSVQSIVLSRIDTLEPADKEALQAASVIGQRFFLEALRHLIENSAYTCSKLISHFLVRPEGDDYLFAHALVHEGVYNSLLKSRRRELHRRAAEWFKDHDPLLYAEHLDRAEDPRAPDAYFESAQTQAAEFHYDRALQLVERGVELAGEKPLKYTLTCFKGQILHDLGAISESIEAFESALTFASDDVQRCKAWLGLAAGMRVADRYDDALEALAKAEAAATTNKLTLDLARLHYLRGNIYFPLGNMDGCLEQHEAALKYAHQAGSPEYEAHALSGLGDAYYSRGRMKTSFDHFRRCVDLAREHGYGRIEVANLNMVGWTRAYLNELSQALQDGLATVELAMQVNHRRAEMVARWLVVKLHTDWGEYAPAREHAEKGLELARTLEARRFEAMCLSYLARISLGQGKHGKAIRSVEEGLNISREVGMSFLGPLHLSTLAMVNDDPAVRKKALREGEAILNDGCVGHNYYWFYRDAMEISLDTGDWEELERYADALEAYTRPEPLPWSDFFIARGRALAAHGKGRRDDALTQDLKRLRDQADTVGFRLEFNALSEALGAA